MKSLRPFVLSVVALLALGSTSCSSDDTGSSGGGGVAVGCNSNADCGSGQTCQPNAKSFVISPGFRPQAPPGVDCADYCSQVVDACPDVPEAQCLALCNTAPASCFDCIDATQSCDGLATCAVSPACTGTGSAGAGGSGAAGMTGGAGNTGASCAAQCGQLTGACPSVSTAECLSACQAAMPSCSTCTTNAQSCDAVGACFSSGACSGSQGVGGAAGSGQAGAGQAGSGTGGTGTGTAGAGVGGTIGTAGTSNSAGSTGTTYSGTCVAIPSQNQGGSAGTTGGAGSTGAASCSTICACPQFAQFKDQCEAGCANPPAACVTCAEQAGSDCAKLAQCAGVCSGGSAGSGQAGSGQAGSGQAGQGQAGSSSGCNTTDPAGKSCGDDSSVCSVSCFCSNGSAITSSSCVNGSCDSGADTCKSACGAPASSFCYLGK